MAWLVNRLPLNPVVYLGVPAGAIMLYYLIRPLAMRRGRFRHLPAFPLEKEPALGALVVGLSRLLGTPTPNVLRFDCFPNASAGYGPGLWNAFFGKRMELTIGLPLIAELSVRQLAGVVAHELAHFSQRHSMRLWYLVQSVNAWFEHLVSQDDQWMREGLRDAEWPWTRAFYAVSFIFVATARGVLLAFLNVSRLLSCALSRQMEYDADRREAMVAGGKSFVTILRRLAELDRGANDALSSLAETNLQGSLPDDLPALILASTGQIRPEHVQAMHERLEREETDLLDTHPSFRDRVASVERAGCKGLFRLHRRAVELVADFPALCRQATLAYYYAVLGRDLSRFKLLALEKLYPHWGERG